MALRRSSINCEEALEGDLIGRPEAEYGSEYCSHILEQYKLYVQMADKISDRRQAANAFFLTINTALIALLGVVWPHNVKLVGAVWYAIVGFAGGLLCLYWNKLLKSYRDLNSGKFKVVHAVEKRLPLKLYDAEWTAVGRGKDPRLYRPFTHIEINIPWIFLILYLTVIGSAIYCQAVGQAGPCQLMSTKSQTQAATLPGSPVEAGK